MTPTPQAQDKVAGLIGRNRAACVGKPAKIRWPHRLLHDNIAALEAQQAENARLREEVAGGERMHRQWHDRALRAERALDHLQLAEHHYRATHDEFGDGHKYTKRAWDDLKREGNAARAALAEPGS